MHVISLSKFRTNQTETLVRALKGESVMLTSRLGAFKLIPISEEDSLTTRIVRGLEQVKMIESGKLPRRTIQDMLNEL